MDRRETTLQPVIVWTILDAGREPARVSPLERELGSNGTEGKGTPMDIQEVIGQARDTMTVKRVFGEPYEKNGVTVIPAAKVQGGAGGGAGEGPEGEGTGFGSGFGLNARPAGAFVIREGDVAWKPAVDVNRVILGAQVVAVIALFVLRTFLRARS